MTRSSLLFFLGVGLAACSGSGGSASGGASSAETANSAPPLHDRAYYEQLAKGAGVTVGSAPVVVGIRGVTRSGVQHATTTHEDFDDVIAVLVPGGAVVEVAASTHPWFTHSDDASDADGDGVPDVGMLKPGHYQVTPRPADRDLAGAPTFHVTTVDGADAVPGWRDTNHDGVYDDNERAASDERGDTLTAILFHQGGPPAPDPIGCQVFAAEDLRALVRAIGGRDVSFAYVLVDQSLPKP